MILLIILAICLLSCRDPLTGSTSIPELVWSRNIAEADVIEYPMQIVLYENRTLVVEGRGIDMKQQLIGIDAASGGLRWVWDDYYDGTPNATIIPFVQSNKFIFGRGRKRYCVDLNNGTTIWKVLDSHINNGRFMKTIHLTQYCYHADISGDSVPMKFAFFVATTDQPESELLYQVDARVGATEPTFFVSKDGKEQILFVETIEKQGQLIPDTYLVCYDYRDKRIIYRTPFHISQRGGLMNVRPGIIYNSMFYKDAGRRIVCYDPNTGKLIWYQDFPGDFFFSGFIIVDGTIYANCEDTYLYALDAETGLIKWREKSSGTSSPLFYMDGVLYYVGGGDGMLHAVDAATGKHLWKIDPPERNDYGFSPSRPTGFDGRLYVTSWTTAYCYRVK
jgi:outer membrane protein assembly factor BamB